MLEISKEQIIKDYYEMTYTELCKKYQISRNTVAEIAKQLNLKKKVGRKMNIKIITDN